MHSDLGYAIPNWYDAKACEIPCKMEQRDSKN